MAPGGSMEFGGLDDVQVLGNWNFTLQADTPLYWLRCGRLDKYLLKFKVHYPCPSTCGLVLHAEADFGGTDGTSFWIERRQGPEGPTKRYLLSGEGLESRPIVTRQYPDDGKDNEDEIEVLMQGYSGVIMVQNRKVQLKFRCNHDKGSIAFYNSTQAERDDVHFSDVRITALRRGPMEIGGTLGKRERAMLGLDSVAQDMGSTAAQDEDFVGSRGEDVGPEQDSRFSSTQARGMQSSWSGSSFAKGGAGRPPRSQLQSSGVLQRSASEGVLRKTTGRGFSRPGSRGATGRGGKWVAVATNAPASEKQLIRDSMRKKAPTANSCMDFIEMPL
eukprot:gb/GFBE01018942.1/.p1 GENE.gb/GFBE01018942.1/~~gb/GFBE01018942.1/.p1  ORF type:complete len:331 (+),score=64.27 gb/GFBE01018942.1/:1-993(+)